MKEKTEETIEGQTQELAGRIERLQAPWLPIFGAEQLPIILGEALAKNQTLFLFSVVCPNWVVVGDKREVAPISENNSNGRVFFGEDLPNLMLLLAKAGIRTRALIAVSDIFSTDWVVDVSKCKEETAQNCRQFRRWFSQEGFPKISKERIDGGDKLPQAKIMLQSQLLEKIGPEKLSATSQIDRQVWQPVTNPWATFIANWVIAEKNQLYPNRRSSLTGIKKIAQRFAFLTGLTISDGWLCGDFLRQAFPQESQTELVVAIDLEMDSPFAEITANGWRTGRELANSQLGLPIITPTIHGTDWSEDHSKI